MRIKSPFILQWNATVSNKKKKTEVQLCTNREKKSCPRSVSHVSMNECLYKPHLLFKRLSAAVWKALTQWPQCRYKQVITVWKWGGDSRDIFSSPYISACVCHSETLFCSFFLQSWKSYVKEEHFSQWFNNCLVERKKLKMALKKNSQWVLMAHFKLSEQSWGRTLYEAAEDQVLVKRQKRKKVPLQDGWLKTWLSHNQRSLSNRCLSTL